MTTTKTYPRARVSRHPVLDGWTVGLILRANAKPIKVNATYATIAFAHKSALTKLGVKTPATTGASTAKGLVSVPKPVEAKNAGTCIPCGRPMRPAGTKAADFPDTVLRQREHLCQTCHLKDQRKGK